MCLSTEATNKAAYSLTVKLTIISYSYQHSSVFIIKKSLYLSFSNYYFFYLGVDIVLIITDNGLIEYSIDTL